MTSWARSGVKRGRWPGLAGLDQQLGHAGEELAQKLVALPAGFAGQDQGGVLGHGFKAGAIQATSVWLEKSWGCS